MNASNDNTAAQGLRGGGGGSQRAGRGLADDTLVVIEQGDDPEAAGGEAGVGGQGVAEVADVAQAYQLARGALDERPSRMTLRA